MGRTGTARSFVVRVAIVALGLQLGGVSTAACGPTSQGIKARDSESYEYTRPIGEVWPELVGLLKDKGYALAETAPVEGKTLETPWRDQGRCKQRYQVRATRIDTKRYTLHMWLAQECDNGQGMQATGEPIRAWDLEVELIERVDPTHAAEIRKRGAEADASRERETSGCSAGCQACSTCATCVARELK